MVAMLSSMRVLEHGAKHCRRWLITAEGHARWWWWCQWLVSRACCLASAYL